MSLSPVCASLNITPILEEDPALYCAIIDRLTEHYQSNPPDCVVCIESFGYVFGAPLAYRLAVRLVLARRQGKLPRETIQQEYQMCYASDKSLEIHRTSIRPGDRVVIVDDVIASGGWRWRRCDWWNRQMVSASE